MDKIQNILVPVDDSVQSKLAFEKAVSFSQACSAHLTILYVVNDRAYSLSSRDPLLEKLLLSEEKRAESHMVERKKYMSEKRVSGFNTEIVTGNPKEKIQNYVKQHQNIGLIFMGATGSGSPYRHGASMGSTTGYVVDHVTCSVVVVR